MSRQIKKEEKCDYCGRKVLFKYQDGELVVWEWVKPKSNFPFRADEGYWRHDCD